jgi:hypothetical protein
MFAHHLLSGRRDAARAKRGDEAFKQLAFPLSFQLRARGSRMAFKLGPTGGSLAGGDTPLERGPRLSLLAEETINDRLARGFFKGQTIPPLLRQCGQSLVRCTY